MYVPPFAGVRLYECRDHLVLVPVPAVREFFAYGKAKATEAVIELENGKTEPFWDNCTPDEEIWAVIQWFRYEDGHEEKGSFRYLRLPHTEEDARKAMREMRDFYSISKEELQAMSFLVTKTDEEREEDLAYIESRYPNYQLPPADRESDEYRVYQARLKVLAGMQPKTVALIQQADEATDENVRKKLEREAVEAYFAEVATYWTDEMLKAWERTNPVGFKWLECIANREGHIVWWGRKHQYSMPNLESAAATKDDLGIDGFDPR